MRFLTDTVVTDAAVRCSGRSEDLTGVAVLELDNLVVNLNVTDSRRRSLPCGDVPIGSLCGIKKHNIHQSAIPFNNSVEQHHML